MLLHQTRIGEYSVAARFSWASRRETTREKDQAYCLLGIFGVHMPLLDGEGENAFHRLQEEISKLTTHMSIFAWQAAPNDKQTFRGMFARSPSEFVQCATFRRKPIYSRNEKEYSITNKGLRFKQHSISPVENPELFRMESTWSPVC